ncbi:MAG: hypothetical protein PHD54_02715, partial [Desulfuromonadaceae bacterium]|nr:hypothetical protein [Desulfuromonadaceae bacterium]
MSHVMRSLVIGVLAALPLTMFSGNFQTAFAQELKISHQFPGGTINEGDFRDRLCRKFAAEVEKRTKGALKGTVYPGSSLMKTNAQFRAVGMG